MTSREFTEWQVYAAMEPFGPLTAYERTGILASQATNIGAGKVVTKPSDFMPSVLEPLTADDVPAPLDLDETKQEALKANAETAMAAWGGKRS